MVLEVLQLLPRGWLGGWEVSWLLGGRQPVQRAPHPGSGTGERLALSTGLYCILALLLHSHALAFAFLFISFWRLGA